MMMMKMVMITVMIMMIMRMMIAISTLGSHGVQTSLHEKYKVLQIR